MHSKNVLSEIINSLKETIHVVNSLVKNYTFTFHFLIFDPVDCVIFGDVIFKEKLDAFPFSVWVVYVEGLEIIEIQLAGWKFIKGVNILLLWLFAIILYSCFRGSYYLLLCWKSWFNGLGTEFNVTKSSNNFWQLDHGL